jgi:hypothetical protein
MQENVDVECGTLTQGGIGALSVEVLTKGVQQPGLSYSMRKRGLTLSSPLIAPYVIVRFLQFIASERAGVTLLSFSAMNVFSRAAPKKGSAISHLLSYRYSPSNR